MKITRTTRTLAILALSVLALLLWGKLKLVTGIHRTAYALGSTDPISSAESV